MKFFFGANLKRKPLEFKIQLVPTIVESYPALFLIKFKAIVFEQRRWGKGSFQKIALAVNCLNSSSLKSVDNY